MSELFLNAIVGARLVSNNLIRNKFNLEIRHARRIASGGPTNLDNRRLTQLDSSAMIEKVALSMRLSGL